MTRNYCTCDRCGQIIELEEVNLAIKGKDDLGYFLFSNMKRDIVSNKVSFGETPLNMNYRPLRLEVADSEHQENIYLPDLCRRCQISLVSWLNEYHSKVEDVNAEGTKRRREQEEANEILQQETGEVCCEEVEG